MTKPHIPVSREKFLAALALIKSNPDKYKHPRGAGSSVVNSCPVFDLHKALCEVLGVVTDDDFELSNTFLSGEYHNIDFKGIRMVKVDLSRVNFNYGKWDGSVLQDCSMPDAPWVNFALRFAATGKNVTVPKSSLHCYFRTNKDQGQKRPLDNTCDSQAQRQHTIAPLL